MLITAPGLSTAAVVTQVSGRGVGMDIVKKKVEGVGGCFAIETRPSMGSRFSISLPVTMTILKGLMVKVHHQIYAIPVVNIAKIIYGRREFIKTIDHKKSLWRTIKAFRLSVCGMNLDSRGMIIFLQKSFLKNSRVIVDVNHKTAGLLVDGLVKEQDMIVKALDRNLIKVKGIGGVTILGTGRVALIIDVPALV